MPAQEEATARTPGDAAKAPALRIDVVTIFPEMVEHAARFGVTGRARERGLWQLGTWNPRDYATDSYRTIDDRPYGGGPGMVMIPGPLSLAIDAARAAQRAAGCAATRAVYLSPAGARVTHAMVAQWAAQPDIGLVLLAGRYEGVDERLVARLDAEVCVGDFVVSGGELPALMLVDAIVRQLPGALNDAQSAEQESFAQALLDCPHYTRPEAWEGEVVPPVLLSGDHAAIRRWRHEQALRRTFERRPDLLASAPLDAADARLVARWQAEAAATKAR
jgi:tRNA (guanine37-N1)-methyltransferase